MWVQRQGQEGLALSPAHGSGLLAEHHLNEISPHLQGMPDDSQVSQSIHTLKSKLRGPVCHPRSE